MLKILFINAARYLSKNILHYSLNLVGFTFSLTCFFLITLYVMNELGYDDFHTKQKDMYRVNSLLKVGEGIERSAAAPFPLSDIVSSEVADVEGITRLLPQQEVIIKVGEQGFKSETCLYVDPSFFDVFDFEILEGNPRTMLSKPSSVVLTQSEKERFYGDKKAIGQSVYVEGFAEPFRVTGILADPPKNSHIQFNVLFSMHSPKVDMARTKWEWNIFYTYLALKPGRDHKQVEGVLASILVPYLDAALTEGFGITYNEFVEQNNQLGYSLQPMEEIYLHSSFDDELGVNGDFYRIIILMSIAILILITAITNYVNFSTASSSGRSKDVAIKKAVGASNFQVGTQYFAESFIFIFMSIIAAITILLIFDSSLSNLLDKDIEVAKLFSGSMLGIMFLLLIVLTFLSGVFPAFYFNRFQPAIVLRTEGFAKDGKKKGGFRDALILLQYFVAFIMIVSSMFIYKQLQFANQQELGYDHENVVVLPINQRLLNKREVVKEELLKLSKVNGISITTNIPNFNHFYNRTMSNISESIENISIAYTEVDGDYLNTLDINLLDGEFFQKNRASDETAVILNKTAADVLKVKDLGAVLDFNGNESRLKVVGIVEDFHFESMHNKIKPLAIRKIVNHDFLDYFIVKVNGEVNNATIEELKSVWNSFLPGSVFEYHILEEQIGFQLKGDKQFAGMVTLFAILALIISIIGTTSLASFIAEKNQKQISIRKVLGATIKDVVIILNKKFVILIGIAMAVALPITWYSTQLWLENFYYSIDYDVLLFFLGCLIVAFISILFINFQYLRTIRTNPVKYLRR